MMKKPVEFILPHELFNLINRNDQYPLVSDDNFLLILDSRKYLSYKEDHIVLAKHCKMNKYFEFVIPEEYRLPYKQNVVVYDNNANSFKDCCYANSCSLKVWDSGSRNTVKVLKGGFELFSRLYPFMKTQKMIWNPRELDQFLTYPIEIIPEFLYIGDSKQAALPFILKDLHISGSVNCTETSGFYLREIGKDTIHINMTEDERTDIFPFFEDVTNFINRHKSFGGKVLIYSEKGMSSSAAFCLGFMMQDKMLSLKEAWDFLKTFHPKAQPLKIYFDALLKYEEVIFSNFEAEAAKRTMEDDRDLLLYMPRTLLEELGY